MHVALNKMPAKVLLLTLIGAFALISLRWIFLYRNNFMLDVDEAGYLRMAIHDYRALKDGGLGQWLLTVFGPGLHSPLVPAVASILFTLLQPAAPVGIIVALGAGCGVIVATYYLALYFSDDKITAFGCAMLVASCPAVVVYSRSFHFSLPATFLLVSALWVGGASDNFRKLGWSILFGVLVGMLPLTRTMTLAFIPGLLIGSAIKAFVDTKSRHKSFRGLVIAGVSAIAVAGTWFASSAATVFQYLISFGYGTRAKDYGPQSSVLDMSSWIVTIGYAKAALFAPHFLLVILAAACGAFLIAPYIFKNALKAIIYNVASSKLFPAALTVVCGLAALTSTSNKGSAYMLPLLPVILILASLMLFRAFKNYRSLVLVFFCLFSIVTFLPMVDLKSDLARNRLVRFPIMDESPITDGAGTFELYYVSIMGRMSQAGDPVPPDERQRWIEIFGEINQYLRAQPGKSIAFGFRHSLLSANHIPFQLDLTGEPPRALIQLDPFQLAENEDAYVEALRASQSCILMLAPGSLGDFPPPMDGILVRKAALRTGFVLRKVWPMPGGRKLELMQRENC